MNRDIHYPQNHFVYKPEYMTPQSNLNSDKQQPNELIEKIATLFAEREKKKFDFNFMRDN